ncbi:MAG: cupin domain-containing protein [Solirubrobacterales bacterium]|nr:cupin domain-containing protein [Solirubrobacterales bacterium]
MTSAQPFQSMDGRKPLSLFPRVTLESIGGEQVLLCRVRYEPGAEVPPHSHKHTEQLMYMLEGELEMTVGTDTRSLHAGDVVVVNRGVEHSLRSDRGCAFFEALSPVPLDHVADRDQDLVLGPDGGRQHVER